MDSGSFYALAAIASVVVAMVFPPAFSKVSQRTARIIFFGALIVTVAFVIAAILATEPTARPPTRAQAAAQVAIQVAPSAPPPIPTPTKKPTASARRSGLAPIATQGKLGLATAPQPPISGAPKAGDSYTNNGINNGIIGPVTTGPPPKPEFHLTPEMISGIVAATPPGKPVVLLAVGGERASQMGQRVVQALQNAGYKVEFDIAAVMLPPPAKPVSVHVEETQTTITIAPNA